MNLKRIIKFIKKNYLIVIFLLIILFTGAISVKRILWSKPTYIYAKVKLGQGLWWNSGQKPSKWLIESINKGDKEVDFVGIPLAEVESVIFYPWYVIDQYDVYLKLRLRVSPTSKSGKYNFKREILSVGSPIELSFPAAQLSGTVIDLSQKPFEDKLIEKEITLLKPFALFWEYDGIKIGEVYHDGENQVFEVLSKNSESSNDILISQKMTASSYFSQTNSKAMRSISVKARIKVRDAGGQLFFGEEQRIVIGKTLNILTPSYAFNDFIITEIK